MKLTDEIKKYLDQSVLCWLATVSSDLEPNVSPKEIFCSYQEEYLLIANIASPKSVKNIKQNAHVCVSFIDIFVQKGYQLKGKAQIIGSNHPEFEDLKPLIEKMTLGNFPFVNIIKIHIEAAKKILAPGYILFPETSERDQIDSALKTYKVDQLSKN